MKVFSSALEKIKSLIESKSWIYGLAGFASAIGGYGLYWVGVPVYQEYQSSFAAKEFKEYGVWGTYQRRFLSFQWKLDEMEKLDRENEELTHKVADLEMEKNLIQSRLTEAQASGVTEVTSSRLQAQTGSALARALSEIKYTPPTHLLPYQLYSVGLMYFRKQEYEPATAIFNQLVLMKDDASYRSAEVYLVSGICWFKLKHYQLAMDAFQHAEALSAHKPEIMKKTFLWQAMVAQALGEHLKAQNLMTALIAHFPHSDEAMSINRLSPPGLNRKVANEKVQDKAKIPLVEKKEEANE